MHSMPTTHHSRNPALLETREYQAMGVLADKEIGQPSDIVSVLYGG